MPSGQSQGPLVFTEGAVLDEEDDAVEVILEDEEVSLAGQWTILARYYSLRIPIQAALFDDMRRAWRLRADMSYKSLRNNMFIITFSAEGDYNFVLQGGPWIHRGDALLVAQFDGITSPSSVPLEVVPIWIRIYDLPLALMTKARGIMYGSKLGQVREVDVGEDGCNKHDFFRIRVDLSVKRPLKPKLAIKIKVRGTEVTRQFDLRYERVPHFCFICGFIGHSDKDCSKRVANKEFPFQFSAELRCSPLKPFERKVSKVKALQSSGVARSLLFRGAGSASSSSSQRKQREQPVEIIPPRVDAHDEFDDREIVGDKKTDEQLAEQAKKLEVSELAIQKSGKPRGQDSDNLSGSVAVNTHSYEMIPAIKNLYQDASFGEGSLEGYNDDTTHSSVDTRGIKKTGRVQQALLEYKQTVEVASNLVRASKRSRKTVEETKREEMEAEVEDMEATSLGAAGQLTGSIVGSRQEQ